MKMQLVEIDYDEPKPIHKVSFYSIKIVEIHLESIEC